MFEYLYAAFFSNGEQKQLTESSSLPLFYFITTLYNPERYNPERYNPERKWLAQGHHVSYYDKVEIWTWFSHILVQQFGSSIF